MSTTFIQDLKSLWKFQDWAESQSILAIDLETTHLSPRQGTIRLAAFSNGQDTWICDAFNFSIQSLFTTLQEKVLVGHNLQFDLSFLWHQGFYPKNLVIDTMLLSQILYAGLMEENKVLKHDLASVAFREAGVELSKELQKSDWSGELTQEQLEYTANDVKYLIPIYNSLWQKIQHFKLETAAMIELRALPAITWMACCGVPFNWEKWQAIAEEQETLAEKLEQELNAMLPEPINVRSWQQVKKAFEGFGIELESTAFEIISQVDHPFAKLLTEYREAQKKVGTYGKNWEEFLHNGRIYPQWGQNFTVTGRMSSNSPNFQNIPREKRYRKCIEAPPGRKLIVADYAGIELRIAAKLANEQRMMKALNNGGDLHTLTASIIRDKDVSQVTKEERQIAKSCNFCLIYGGGAEKLQKYAQAQFGVSIPLEEAELYRRKFFDAYPDMRKWHKSGSIDPVTTRTLAGRWRIGVEKFSEKLNTPTQGTGADGLKLALALLWERCNECPNSFPIIACHDELVAEAPEEEAAQAKEWVERAMIDGMSWLIHPVKTEVEAKICENWSQK
jgi:DNA polymerase-1